MEQDDDQGASVRAVIQPGDHELESKTQKEHVIPGDGAAKHQRQMPDGAEGSKDRAGKQGSVGKALLKFRQGVGRPAEFLPLPTEEDKHDHARP